MATMNGPDGTLEKGERRLRMTKSRSGEEGSCFGLRCHSSRYHHSDNCAAENTPPVIPPSSVRPHLKAADNGCAAAAVKKGNCVILMTASPSLPVGLFFVSLLPPSLSLFLRPRLSAPAPSRCPR